MRTVQNTTKLPPEILLIGAMVNPSGHIEAMEAAGQKQFAASDTLPSEYTIKNRPTLEKLGFVIGEKVEGDEIFMFVKLPAGWTKKAAPGSDYWTYIFDEQKRPRGSVFYKAAFYDRSAHWSMTPRYSIHQDYDFKSKKAVRIAVKDGGKIIHFVEFALEEGTPDYYQKLRPLEEAATKQCEEWLGSHIGEPYDRNKVCDPFNYW